MTIVEISNARINRLRVGFQFKTIVEMSNAM